MPTRDKKYTTNTKDRICWKDFTIICDNIDFAGDDTPALDRATGGSRHVVDPGVHCTEWSRW